MDFIMVGSVIESLADNQVPWQATMNKRPAFKSDPIRAEVASTSCCYNPLVFCDLLADHIALSNFHVL